MKNPAAKDRKKFEPLPGTKTGAKPAELARSAKSAKPARSVKSAETAQFTKPAQSSKPEKSAMPAQKFSTKKIAGKGKVRRVLGIDPGLASTGFGVVDFKDGRYRMVGYGVIETKAHSSRSLRLLALYARLLAVIDEFRPTEAAMETLYFARNASSAMSVAEARGVATLCIAQQNIPLGEYTPNQIKQAVTGTAGADKATVEQYVKILLGLETEPKPDHAADALAGAITHIHYSAI